MGRSSVNEVSTSGRTNESDNEGEVGLKQFLDFPSQLVSYPPGVKSTVERKESLLDEVAEEETKLELALEGLGLIRKKWVGSRSNKVARLFKEIWLGIEEEKSDLKEVNVELEKELAQSRAHALKYVKQLKASQAMAIGQLQVEIKANLDEMVEERDRLGNHLMLKGYSEEEVELDSSRAHEDDILMCNREFVEQFDRMKEVSENREDQYVKAHFRLVELTQAISVLTRQAEEKYSEIKNGLKELAEVTERTEKFQGQVDALDVKGKKGHVQKGNVNFRECQHKLDVVLIREKVMDGEIKAKESLVKRKEKLLKDIPAREELNAEIRRLRARVVDLKAMNLAE
ncbi:hypothetical protein GIB67_014599 [Kingdonia uniflora]|uniref:Uncharacterized protein n=1 Tax=Kingdonia uniflora TaxID=39325 RepID=A0A7J7MPA2_9MAGN|nr:hypothetical protein GIB67_014599 [Kingdonia uniflora]